jgi:hypothetical protein
MSRDNRLRHVVQKVDRLLRGVIPRLHRRYVAQSIDVMDARYRVPIAIAVVA